MFLKLIDKVNRSVQVSSFIIFVETSVMFGELEV
jgi:hypothetical protein